MLNTILRTIKGGVWGGMATSNLIWPGDDDSRYSLARDVTHGCNPDRSRPGFLLGDRLLVPGSYEKLPLCSFGIPPGFLTPPSKHGA